MNSGKNAGDKNKKTAVKAVPLFRTALAGTGRNTYIVKYDTSATKQRHSAQSRLKNQQKECGKHDSTLLSHRVCSAGLAAGHRA
ncbi:protein of unknown function [Serratia sp. Tan611]|nr:protein of unknown function [Serratia sp. Tan611]